MEMRCLCPPENSEGRLSRSLAESPTSSSAAAAFSLSSAFPMLRAPGAPDHRKPDTRTSWTLILGFSERAGS